MSSNTSINAEALALIELFLAAGRPSDWGDELPTDEARQRDLASEFDQIGVRAFNAGDFTLAHYAFWHLFLLRLKIVTLHPGDRADIQDFATAEDLFGRAMLEVGNLEPAEQMFTEALRYRRGLFEDEPGDAHAAYLYGIALWHMARIERAKANIASEIEWARQARNQLILVNEAWPAVTYITEALSEVEERLAQM